MISLFTRAIISSTTFPSPVRAGFPGLVGLAMGVAGFFGCSGSGAAICGASREGGFCAWGLSGGGFAGGFCAGGWSGGGGLGGGFCASSGRGNSNPGRNTVFFFIFPLHGVY